MSKKPEDTARMLFQHTIPFTPSEYKQESPAGRLALLKKMAARIIEHVDPFTWKDLLQEFDKDPQEFLPCPHQIQTWKTVMAYEKELFSLRERMEDLCLEMERVKKGEGRMFIMGPGVDTNAET